MSQKTSHKSSAESENNFSQIVISPGWDQLSDFQFVPEEVSSIDGQQILKAVDLLRSKSVDGYHSRTKITEETAAKYFGAGKSFNSKRNFIADNLEHLTESLKSRDLNESEIRDHLADSRELITSALSELEVLKDVLEATKKKSNSTYQEYSNEAECILSLLSDLEKNFEEKIRQKQMTSNMFETGQLVQYGSNSFLTGFGTFDPYADFGVSAPAERTQQQAAPKEVKVEAEKKAGNEESVKTETKNEITEAEKAAGLKADGVANVVRNEMSAPAEQEAPSVNNKQETVAEETPVTEEVKPEVQKTEETSGMNAAQVADEVKKMTPQKDEESNSNVVENEAAPTESEDTQLDTETESENTAEKEVAAKKLFDTIPELEPEHSMETLTPEQHRENVKRLMQEEAETTKASESQAEEAGSVLDEDPASASASPETSGVRQAAETIVGLSASDKETKVDLPGRSPSQSLLSQGEQVEVDNKVYSSSEIIEKIGGETIELLKKINDELKEIQADLEKVEGEIRSYTKKGLLYSLFDRKGKLSEKLRNERCSKLKELCDLKKAEREIIESSIKENFHDLTFIKTKETHILTLVAIPAEKYNALPTVAQIRMVLNIPLEEEKLVIRRQGEKLPDGGHKPDDVLELVPHRNGKFKLYLNGKKVSETNTAYADDALKIADWFKKSDPGAPIKFTGKKYTEYTIVTKDFYSYN